MTEALDPLMQARYARIADLLDAAMMRLATHEAEVVQQVVNAATEEAIITELPSERQLRAGVLHGLFPSPTKPTDLATTGTEWWQRQGESLSQRVGDSLTIGVALEESLTTLTQRVRGTSEQGFQDGIMSRARDDAARLLTTHVTHTIGETRVATADRNPGHGLMLLHSSRLDSRTSLLCIGRNGLRYEVGTHDPIGHSIPYLTGVPYHPCDGQVSSQCMHPVDYVYGELALSDTARIIVRLKWRVSCECWPGIPHTRDGQVSSQC